MSFKLELTPSAAKCLRKLAKQDKKQLLKIDRAILTLSKEPLPPASKQLVGEKPHLYRLRVGEYRILYRIENEILTILILQIGQRREIYRQARR